MDNPNLLARVAEIKAAQNQLAADVNEHIARHREVAEASVAEIRAAKEVLATLGLSQAVAEGSPTEPPLTFSQRTGGHGARSPGLPAYLPWMIAAGAFLGLVACVVSLLSH